MNIICKHMIALYFVAFPNEAEGYIKEIEEYEAGAEQRQLELDEKIEKYIDSLSKKRVEAGTYGNSIRQSRVDI